MSATRIKQENGEEQPDNVRIDVKQEPFIKEEEAVEGTKRRWQQQHAGSAGAGGSGKPSASGSGHSSMLPPRAYAGPYPHWAEPSRAACRQVAERLAALHGWPSLRRKAQPGQPQVGCEEKRSVLDSLVRTLLSQNTTDVTSGRAFAQLKQAFPAWEAVRAAPLAQVADAIRVGGLAEIKAGRIQTILETLVQERGQCSLEHLRQLPTHEVKAELGRFKGVGKKTVSCVLLFALERDDFAVDTHVWEITKSLGWVPTNASRDQTYDHLNDRVPEELRYDLHVLLVNHGKTCGLCAKAGSAKARAAAAAAAAAVDCPLSTLKPPKSQLKASKAAPASAAAAKGKSKGGSGKQQEQQQQQGSGEPSSRRRKVAAV